MPQCLEASAIIGRLGLFVAVIQVQQ